MVCRKVVKSLTVEVQERYNEVVVLIAFIGAVDSAVHHGCSD